MFQPYYIGATFLNLVVLTAVLGGMSRREQSEVRVYYAISAVVLFCCSAYLARQGGLIFWLISDPREGR